MTIKDIKDKGYLVYEAMLCDELFTGKKSNRIEQVVGVYVLPQDLILGGHGINEYTNHGLAKDTTSIYRAITENVEGVKTVYYELRHFLRLLKDGIPHAIEALFAGDFGIQHSECFEILNDFKDRFVTKKLKYTFGWNSLIKFMEKKTESFYSLCTFMNSIDGKALNFYEYINQTSKKHINPEAIFLVHISGDLYEANYSYVEASKSLMVMGQQRIGTQPTGLWMDESTGKLACCKLEEDERRVRSIYPLGYIYFNSQAYKKWHRDQRPTTNLEFAKAYRRAKASISIGDKKTIVFPVPDILVYDDIRDKGNTVSPSAVESWTNQINLAWDSSHLPEYITNETVNKLELQIRQRHHLLQSIEKSTIEN